MSPGTGDQVRLRKLEIHRIQTGRRKRRPLDQRAVGTDHHRTPVEHQFVLTAQQVDVDDGNMTLPAARWRSTSNRWSPLPA
jgi:hypothetical protein